MQVYISSDGATRSVHLLGRQAKLKRKEINVFFPLTPKNFNKEIQVFSF